MYDIFPNIGRETWSGHHLTKSKKQLKIDPKSIGHYMAKKGRGQKKNGIMWGKFPNWGGSDPNPLFDVYLPSYFWHAKMILRC